jgi:uncharacterized ferritin-like protein (DUF455 family)
VIGSVSTAIVVVPSTPVVADVVEGDEVVDVVIGDRWQALIAESHTNPLEQFMT